MRQINRDPFARVTYYRRTVRVSADAGCRECGSVKATPLQDGQRPRLPRQFLYQYGAESDGIRSRVEWERELFCGKNCHDSYHR